MVKSGTPEEHFSEIFTAALGKHLGFDMAEYMLDGAYVISKDFTEGRLNFEPMANLVQDNEDYDYNYDVLQNLNPPARETVSGHSVYGRAGIQR